MLCQTCNATAIYFFLGGVEIRCGILDFSKWTALFHASNNGCGGEISKLPE